MDANMKYKQPWTPILIFTIPWTYYDMVLSNGGHTLYFKRGHALNSIVVLFSLSCTLLGTVDVRGWKCVLDLKVC